MLSISNISFTFHAVSLFSRARPSKIILPFYRKITNVKNFNNMWHQKFCSMNTNIPDLLILITKILSDSFIKKIISYHIFLMLVVNYMVEECLNTGQTTHVCNLCLLINNPSLRFGFF